MSCSFDMVYPGTVSRGQVAIRAEGLLPIGTIRFAIGLSRIVRPSRAVHRSSTPPAHSGGRLWWLNEGSELAMEDDLRHRARGTGEAILDGARSHGRGHHFPDRVKAGRRATPIPTPERPRRRRKETPVEVAALDLNAEERIRRFWKAHARSFTHLTVLHASVTTPNSLGPRSTSPTGTDSGSIRRESSPGSFRPVASCGQRRERERSTGGTRPWPGSIPRARRAGTSSERPGRSGTS
jgi:hypothetical protein